MSAEGYAYISLVLLIQQEQANTQIELMRGRRYGFDQDYTVREKKETKQRGYVSKYIQPTFPFHRPIGMNGKVVSDFRTSL